MLPREALLSLGVCIFYGSCSLSLGLLNKYLLSGYGFEGYFMLLAGQMFFSIVICLVLRRFGNSELIKIPVYDKATHMSSISMGACYVANVAAGLVALKLVNIPMFFCIRRLMTLFIMGYEFMDSGLVQPWPIQASVLIGVVGTIIASRENLKAEALGYAVSLLANVFTAAVIIKQKRFCMEHGLSAFGVLFYNACTGLPMALAFCFLTGEVAGLLSFADATTITFWMCLAVSCMLGPVLTYSSMLSTTYNSPLATAITGNTKDLAITFIGAPEVVSISLFRASLVRNLTEDCMLIISFFLIFSEFISINVLFQLFLFLTFF